MISVKQLIALALARTQQQRGANYERRGNKAFPQPVRPIVAVVG